MGSDAAVLARARCSTIVLPLAPGLAVGEAARVVLFNSYVFVFLFLPFVLAGDVWLVRRDAQAARYGWLLACSLIFYAYWKPVYVVLPVLSILVNYALGMRLAGVPEDRATLLPLGVAANLLTLGYYKYAGFFVRTLSSWLDVSWSVPAIVLPLGISFFTFQQIAFLVDCAHGEARETRFVDYALFVVFFPQLIAGPIVHHSELMPQFARGVRRALVVRLADGLPMFALGLFKKAVLADGVAPFANSVFGAADSGAAVTFVDGWVGALAYTLQLYFDFSGYSDMALGLGRMFGVKLPLNFDSPYKARNISEFWRRWHMTLSRFLRDYVYIPLGGNRRGSARRYLNLMITMVLGGFWHGAGFNFLLWGGLHGLLLCLHHAYRKAWSYAPGVVATRVAASRAFGMLHWALTFGCVVAAWVLFRAETAQGARAILKAMAAVDRIEVPAQLGAFLPASLTGVLHPSVAWVVSLRDPVDGVLRVMGLLAIALVGPNSHTLLSYHDPALGVAPSEHPLARALSGYRLPLAVTAGAALGVALSLMSEDEFLYFNF